MKKINNKGFTLVELIAVVVILVIILLVALPNMSSSIEKRQKKDKINIESIIKDAGELYISNYIEGVTVDSNGYCYFAIKTLTTNNYLTNNDIDEYKNGCIIFDKTNNNYFVTKDSYTGKCIIDSKNVSTKCIN